MLFTIYDTMRYNDAMRYIVRGAHGAESSEFSPKAKWHWLRY